MRERFKKQKSVKMTNEMHDKIANAAKNLEVSFGDIVRGCVERELDKLIDREKRRRRQRRKEQGT